MLADVLTKLGCEREPLREQRRVDTRTVGTGPSQEDGSEGGSSLKKGLVESQGRV